MPSKIVKHMSAKERKEHPIFRGVLKYFPNALLEVAHLSKVGNDQHNPGEPLHWAMEKSTDEGDALVRHQLDAGTRDTDGERHSAKVAWRALAQLEREILAEQAELDQQAEASVIPVRSYQMDPTLTAEPQANDRHSLSDQMIKELRAATAKVDHFSPRKDRDIMLKPLGKGPGPNPAIQYPRDAIDMG